MNGRRSLILSFFYFLIFLKFSFWSLHDHMEAVGFVFGVTMLVFIWLYDRDMLKQVYLNFFRYSSWVLFIRYFVGHIGRKCHL